MDPGTASLIGSGLGFMGGKKGADSAARAQREAMKGANMLAMKSAAWFDRGSSIFNSLYNGGEFDPASNISRLRSSILANDVVLKRNAAAAAVGAGYKPGDSKIAEDIGKTSQISNEKMWNMEDATRTNALNKLWQSYRAVDPTTNNAGIQLQSQNAQMYGQQAAAGYSAAGQLLGDTIKQLPQLFPKKTTDPFLATLSPGAQKNIKFDGTFYR